MQRIEVFTHTGNHAENAKIARRLNRKIKAILALRETVLLDYEKVTCIENSFFTIVLNLPDLSQVRVCRLAPDIRAKLFPAECQA